MVPTQGSRCLTISGAARKTGLSLSAIRKLIASGEIKTAKLPPELGLRSIVPEIELDALLTRMYGERTAS